MLRAQWYQGTGTRMLLIVITRCWSGKIPWRVYFCTDASVTVPQPGAAVVPPPSPPRRSQHRTAA